MSGVGVDDGSEWIVRHRLRSLRLAGTRLSSPAEVVEHLVALQAQEAPYARWSVAQRVKGSPSARTITRAIDDGEILRTHVLRPTWHYVSPKDLGWLLRLSGPRVEAGNARRYRELDLDRKILASATRVISNAVAHGPRTRRELAAILAGRGIPPTGQRMPYFLMHAELQAVICSGPLKEREHTYAPFDQRVASHSGPSGEHALHDLALRYFSSRGPATAGDFAWWSGLSAADARAGLDHAKSHLESRQLGGRTYWFTETSISRTTPLVHLVQCYDEVIIAYRETRAVLQSSRAQFPVPRHLGGFTHVVLLDGRLLGHWRRFEDRGGVHVEVRIDSPMTFQEQRAVTAAVDRYRQFADIR